MLLGKSVVVIAGERQSGKTTKLVNVVKNDPEGFLFVNKNCTVKFLMHRFPELLGKVFSVNCFSYRGKPFKRAYFDDVEFLPKEKINSILEGCDLGGVAYTTNRN